MEKELGLWIDRKKTVIVKISGDGEEIRQIRSNLDADIQLSSDDIRGASTQDMQEMQSISQLSGYYDAVISMIRDADSILIFGPGEAKNELGKRMESEDLNRRIVGIESANKMTDRQIVAKVHSCFSE